MTAVAGGVIRELLSGLVPLLLRRDIYATAAIVGIFFYLLMQLAGIERSWAFIVGIMSIGGNHTREFEHFQQISQLGTYSTIHYAEPSTEATKTPLDFRGHVVSGRKLRIEPRVRL
jgi:hypothetical protein